MFASGWCRYCDLLNITSLNITPVPCCFYDIALEYAYDTLAAAQIAVQKAANIEAFCVKSLRSKVGSSKRKIVWLDYSRGGSYRAEVHGVCSTSIHLLCCPWCIIVQEGGKESCWNVDINPPNTITSAPTIL